MSPEIKNKYNINNNKMTITGTVPIEAEVYNTERLTEPIRGYCPDTEGGSIRNNSQPKTADHGVSHLRAMARCHSPPPWLLFNQESVETFLKLMSGVFSYTWNMTSCAVWHAEFLSTAAEGQ